MLSRLARRRTVRRPHYLVGYLAIAVWLAGCASGQDVVGQRRDYSPVTSSLREFIEEQLVQKQISGASVALIDDQETVWARGFGWADPDARVAASASTVYRVGSVSKLFTDLGIMQLVERGVLDLDAAVTRYLPEFDPVNPFGKQITLRQLMSHHSGLVREPPVGHYFDATDPSLGETVASLNGTSLVYEPETRFKYSNAAIATVGYVLERTQGEPFAKYLMRTVLDPMGLHDSAFELDSVQADRAARGEMWAYDGRTFVAPTFELGMAPAGNMYSTVTDLARFVSVLFAGGALQDGYLVQQATLDSMWTPQFTSAGQGSGTGIGFALSRLDGHRSVGHGGAIYGFATQLLLLPDERLGAVAVVNKDVANSVATRIVEAALGGMLALRNGATEFPVPSADPLPSGMARSAAGQYGSGANAIELEQWDERLFLLPRRGGSRVELRAAADGLVVDDPLAWGQRLELLDDAVVFGGDTLTRVAFERPSPVPDRWRGLIGEYGWDHNTLYVLERGGRLNALIEWFFTYPLEPVARDTFAFPDWGLYHGERLVFRRDPSGGVSAAVAGGVRFERRSVGPDDGGTFQIEPLHPIEELRAAALSAEPPAEPGEFRDPELVEVVQLDSTIQLDIRYATANNFMGAVFYSEPRAFLQRPAAEAVVRAHRKLQQLGYGLLLHDAYRPWYVTKMFWDATPESQKIFVANPATGSRHNRGCAIDLTLFDLATGEPVAMVGGYDEFSHRSYARYPGGTALQRWQRELLRRIMEEEGFRVYPYEWWHFDYRDWADYAIQNDTFEELDARGSTP
jgi:CubicO group peptidase (beta-lactamase class C family)/D-alanyl-D-alanine dipeptidase